jgi:hypothetical protein
MLHHFTARNKPSSLTGNRRLDRRQKRSDDNDGEENETIAEIRHLVIQEFF